MEIQFGLGNLVIDTGTFGGKPAVFIAPASQPGNVGESAKRENHDLARLVDGEHVLLFPTPEQAKSVADAICGTRD